MYVNQITMEISHKHPYRSLISYLTILLRNTQVFFIFYRTPEKFPSNTQHTMTKYSYFSHFKVLWNPFSSSHWQGFSSMRKLCMSFVRHANHIYIYKPVSYILNNKFMHTHTNIVNIINICDVWYAHRVLLDKSLL